MVRLLPTLEKFFEINRREPDEDQLEVALASIKAVLELEESYNLKNAKEKVVTLQEVEIKNLEELGSTNLKLKDFLEALIYVPQVRCSRKKV